MILFTENLKRHDFPYEPDARLSRWHLAEVEFGEIWVTDQQVERFDPDHVIDIYKNFHPALMRPPSLVFIDGRLVCWDGHHTAAVCLLKGFEKCPCVVYEAEDWGFRSIPTSEKLDHSQLIGIIQSLPEDILSQIR